MDKVFYQSDIVCRKFEDTLEFGRVYEVCNGNKIPLDETVVVNGGAGDSKDNCKIQSGGPFNSPTDTDTAVRVLWDDEKNRCTGFNRFPRYSYVISTKDENLKLVDRRFIVGQRVQCGGLHGKVIGCERLVTVRVVGSEVWPMIIPDVKLENIEPITDLFYGVIVEFCGWVGQITKVHRRALYKPEAGPEFFTSETDPPSWTTSKYVEQGDQIGLSYPYMTLSSDPYAGKRKRFGPSELTRKAVFQLSDSAIQDVAMCRKLARDPIMCHSVEVTGVTVSWMGRLPCHLPSWDTVPNPLIQGDDLQRVHPLYINPSLYFDKDGISNCNGGGILTETKWIKDFLGPQYNVEDASFSEMKSFNEGQSSSQSPAKKFLVQKVFSRHLYTVKLNFPSEPMKYYGFQLELERDREHSLHFVFHNFFFYKRNGPGTGFAENEYGVVLERASEDTVMVQWLRVDLAGGTVNCASRELEKCKFLDISKHPTFGDLCEGRIVVASKAAREFGNTLELIIGTILNVDRWDSGKIRVFCAIEKRQKIVWPHQIENFQEFSANEQMRLKLKGRNKFKSEKTV